MSKSKFWILLYKTHAWVGLLSGIFLLFICTTGSIAVFKPEIERAVDWKGYDFNVTPTPAGPIPIEQAIATAQAAFPGSTATLARFPDFGGSIESHGETYAISLSRPKPNRPLTVLVDPYTDNVVASMAPSRTWSDFIRQLHVRFLYGSYWGRWIVGFFGLVLLFATVSGLMIFTRFNANSWRPKLRTSRGPRILTADLHKIVGLSSVAFNIVFGISGAVIGLEGLYRKYLMTQASPAAITRAAGVREITPNLLTQCANRARQLIPGATPSFITLSHARNGTIRVNVETPVQSLVKEGASYVTFDARTGNPLETYDARSASAAGRFYYSMEPLHFGRLGGYLWVKLLWALMGLTASFLSLSGFAIYLLRKRKPATRPVPITQPIPPPLNSAPCPST